MSTRFWKKVPETAVRDRRDTGKTDRKTGRKDGPFAGGGTVTRSVKAPRARVPDGSIVFRAFVVAGEMDLNRMAVKSGIPKKYTWEEALVFDGDRLREIVGRPCGPTDAVHVFSFGSVVTIDLTPEDDLKVFTHLRTLDARVTQKEMRFSDDYELRVGGPGTDLTDRYVTVPAVQLFHRELIATVLAKSVALEKIEELQADVMDQVDPLIERLEKGKLRISDKKVAHASSHIARCEYNSIATIMLLDKPDVTWSNIEAGTFYDVLSDFFELSDRYKVLREKNEILSSVVNGISTTSHTINSVTIELAVLILIAVEVVIMLMDLFR